MTVFQLIEHLKQFNGNAIVYAYDPNSETDEEVTGLLYDESSDGLLASITICTDEL